MLDTRHPQPDNRESLPSPTAGDDGPWANLPNRITALRLAALPILWILAALRETTWLAMGVALAALTDVIDGMVARSSRRTTSFGRHLDSVADHLLTFSLLLWLLWLRPEFFARERVPLALWAALAGLALLIGWLRFRRVGGAHLYSAKAAGVLGYLFAIGLLFSGTYAPWAFYAVLSVALLAALETLLVVLTRSRIDEHSGSILLPSPRREQHAHGPE